ncbi:hypothetical protein CYLTODRAFT_424913 [Cylindrobasidium torrendii FP15055 ss-10]|uniref:Uncharacterized protein n=1 Tax=Cylindrobasidium torrendii FP15055 ss-10 TaxID=1314674 RepID=A0A0D7B3M2_9AGAR|nr:hypothetical protein CYLTODRAFT_424913 [Cylindrobasidium torrendii FP15055 ss-10]
MPGNLRQIPSSSSTPHTSVLSSASLLVFVSVTRITPDERSNFVATLFLIAALANLVSAYLRFHTGGVLSMLNSAILLIGASAALVGAARIRVRQMNANHEGWLFHFLDVDGVMHWDWDADVQVLRQEEEGGADVSKESSVYCYCYEEQTSPICDEKRMDPACSQPPLDSV